MHVTSHSSQRRAFPTRWPRPPPGWVPPLPSFAAGKGAAVLVDADDDGLASPGDTLRYTVVVQNTSWRKALRRIFDESMIACLPSVVLTIK